MPILTLLSLFGCFVTGVPGDPAPLIRHHLDRYPLMGVQDVYKMLYQGEFGVGHLLGDGKGARRYLLEELATMDTTDRGEELLEPVSADGGMVRVNLRPFRRLGHSPDLLLQAMTATVAGTNGDTARFVTGWHSFAASACAEQFDQAELRQWDERVRRGEIVIAHHSPRYTGAYRPAYRVCRRSAIEALLGAREAAAR